MFFDMIERRTLKHTRCLAVWALTFLVLGTLPANAGVITILKSDSADRSVWSLESSLTSLETFFASDISYESGWGSGTGEYALNLPSSPAAPLPFDSPLIGVAFPVSQRGTGAGSTSPANGSTSLSANAILCWHSELPPLTLVGHLYSVEDLDIPPAPPFELLRPPRIRTTLM